MSVCDWFNKWRYVPDSMAQENARDYNEKLRKEVDAMCNAKPGEVLFCRPDFYEKYKAECAKPESVESVLNQFIALGHEKPVVVIKGVKRHDGSEQYKATIDGEPVNLVLSRLGWVGPASWRSVDDAEEGVIKDLKKQLSAINIETIEITY